MMRSLNKAQNKINSHKKIGADILKKISPTLSLVLSYLVLQSCSLFSTNSDQRKPSQASNPICSSQNMCEDIHQYHQAIIELNQNHKLESCKMFVQLGQKKDFILYTQSWLHAFLVCPAEVEIPNPEKNKMMELKDFAEMNVPNWLEDSKTQALLVRSQLLKNEFFQLQSLLKLLTTAAEQSKRSYLNQQGQAETWIETALEIIKRHEKIKTADDPILKLTSSEDILKISYEISPRMTPEIQNILTSKLGKEEILKVFSQFENNKLWIIAKDFQRQAKPDSFEMARKIYQYLFEQEKDFEKKYQALDSIRNTHKLAREADHSKLFQSAQDLLQFSEKQFKLKNKWASQYIKASLTLAGHYWTFADSKNQGIDLALKTLNHTLEVIDESESNYPTDEILWMQARIADEQGDAEKALKLLSAAGEKIKDPDKKDSILWSKAFILYKIKRYNEASTVFAEMITKDPKEFNPRAHFWRAKSLKQANLNNQISDDSLKNLMSLPDLQWLQQNDPYGYYGLLAYRELKMPLPSIQSIKKSKSDNLNFKTKWPQIESKLKYPPFQNQNDFELSAWLLSTQDYEFEKRLLDDATQKLNTDPTKDITTWLSLFKLYAQAQSYYAFFDKFNRLPTEIKVQLITDDPDLLFPTDPYTQLVKENAKKYNVDWAYVFSIMRQESAFNPQARSGANAFGLLQLIPENAISIAKEIHLNLPTHLDSKNRVQLDQVEVLYDPQINIPLGTALMHKLFNLNKNSFIRTTASYNASPDVVNKWIKVRYQSDILAFIDDIPYEETKTYVKTVMRNYIFYKRLDSPEQELKFPEWCLAL